MLNLANEISRELPEGAAERQFSDGEPILCAFECALLERETDGGFVYTAVNLVTNASAIISHRKSPLTVSDVDAVVEKIHKSKVAGAGRYQADRKVGESLSLEQAFELLNAIFREILPNYGYAIREQQITLAEHILTAIAERGVILAEAQTGGGKTDAYLLAAIIAKHGRLNDEKNRSLYPEMAYSDMAKMPAVIATSSIALQKSLVTEYIPELSRILLENGVISTPITAVIRKGRENYACAHNISAEHKFCRDKDTRRTLKALLEPDAEIDLAEVAGLDARTRKHIAVPKSCHNNCKHRQACAYFKFREQAQSYDIDIQVCNHNYLLADTRRRAKNQETLIPNYQVLIIDEAHKFVPGAARSIYAASLESASAGDILKEVERLDFKSAGLKKAAWRAAEKLADTSARLFADLSKNAKHLSDEDENTQLAVSFDTDTAREIGAVRKIAEQLSAILREENVRVKAAEVLEWVRQKYNADASKIDIRSIFCASPEPQEKRVGEQAARFYRAVCSLPEIAQRADSEREKRLRRKFYDPVKYVLAAEKSAVKDKIWTQVKKLCQLESAHGEASELVVKLLWRLRELRDQAAAFADCENLICWLETGENGQVLCATPKDIGARLYADQWRKNIPTVFTSGTMSAGGDFTRTKQTLGLNALGDRVSEISTPSPFNYRKNCLLYLSKNVPYPNPDSPAEYIGGVAAEIERLVKASNGHAAVLFTSNSVMNRTHAELLKKHLAYPIFKLEKASSSEIERFKNSRSGVLFASGALWEGIDIPGDALSLLIIVKLPFAVPDAVFEYEREQYADRRIYLDEVLTPDMLIKLKQGFGRLIRTESDTGVCAILDCRANENGAYYQRVLNALPDCHVTHENGDIPPFYRLHKSDEYFRIT